MILNFLKNGLLKICPNKQNYGLRFFVCAIPLILTFQVNANSCNLQIAALFQGTSFYYSIDPSRTNTCDLWIPLSKVPECNTQGKVYVELFSLQANPPIIGETLPQGCQNTSSFRNLTNVTVVECNSLNSYVKYLTTKGVSGSICGSTVSPPPVPEVNISYFETSDPGTASLNLVVDPKVTITSSSGRLDCLADGGLFPITYTITDAGRVLTPSTPFSCASAPDINCTNNLVINGAKIKFTNNIIGTGKGTLSISADSASFTYTCPL